MAIFIFFFFFNSEATILPVFFSLVLTGWKWVQKMHEVEYGNTVWCSPSGFTCQWAYHREVMNGCDFPNSGLGKRQNGLQNNFGSLGWVAVNIDVLGSQESRIATPCPYLLCYNLTEPCPHKAFAWIRHTAHIRRLIFIICPLVLHVAWAADATEAGRDANRLTMLPRIYQNKKGREWDIITTALGAGVAGPGWRGWTRWQSS